MMKRVLIAEDDFDLQDILSYAFTKLQFEVRIARDGQEALQCLTENSTDVLVLDINMPRVSGLDVLTHIHRHPELQAMKIIVVTGSTKASYAPQVQYADLVLTKPVSVRDLTEFAERLMVS